MKFKKIFLSEIQFQFPNHFSFIGYLVGIVLNLFIFFVTSKAFKPNTDINNKFIQNGYFEFIVIGELTLIMSHIALVDALEVIKRYRSWGILEQFYFSKIGIFREICQVYYSKSLEKIFHAFLFIGISSCLFNLGFNFKSFIVFTLVQIIFVTVNIPIFIFAVLITLLSKKENRGLHYFVTILTIASGAYFPLEVFTNTSLLNILKFNPLAMQLKITRTLLYSTEKISFVDFNFYLCWMFFFLIISYLVFKLFKNVIRENLQ